jgi:hypothetical protein
MRIGPLRRALRPAAVAAAALDVGIDLAGRDATGADAAVRRGGALGIR